MSGTIAGIAISTIAEYAAVAGVAYSVADGVDKSRKAGHAQQQASEQQQQAIKRANANDLKQQQQLNKQNQKRASSSNALANAQQAAKGGVSGTMLTGAGGAQSGILSKTTLLGQ